MLLTMKYRYNLIQRLVAFSIILSLFLQSCNNYSNHAVPQIKTPNDTVQESYNPLKDQELVAEKVYLVSFHEQDGRLQADIRVDVTQKNLIIATCL